MPRNDKKQNPPRPDNERDDDVPSPGADAGGSEPPNCKSTSFNCYDPSFEIKERRQLAREEIEDIKKKQMKLTRRLADLDRENSDL